MKTIVFTEKQENACADALAQDVARDFLTGCSKDVLHTSSYLVVGWARVLVRRNIVPQFELRAGGKTIAVDKGGRLSEHPHQLCILDDILEALLDLRCLIPGVKQQLHRFLAFISCLRSDPSGAFFGLG